MNMKFVFEYYSLTCRTIYQQPALNFMSFLLLFKIKHKKSYMLQCLSIPNSIPSACCLLPSPVKKQMFLTHLTSKCNDIVCKIMGYLFLLELTGLSIFRCDTVKKLRKTTDE